MRSEVEQGPRSTARRKHGRAGRNLWAALGVGVVLGAVVLASLFVQKVAFVALVAVAVILAVWELSEALAARGIRVPRTPVIFGSVAILVGAYSGGAQAQLVTLALTALAVLVWRLGDSREGYVRDVTAGIFTAHYVPFLAGFAILLLRPDDGPLRVLVFILVTVSSDLGGYVFGVLFGRHPMAPAISPKKSWEGFGGSVVLCLLAGGLAVPLLLGGPWWSGLVLGGATVFSATLGDLVESMIKRDLGIKDMSGLLPGHGGLMDRLDSLLPTAPVAWLVLALLVPVG